MSQDEILPPLTTEDKMLSGLCYPFWMFTPPFVLASSKREDPFLLFHALQGVALGVLSTLVTCFGMVAMWVAFSCLPTSSIYFGALGMMLLIAFLGFAGLLFGVSIFYGWQASSGHFTRIPGIGELCEARMGLMLDLHPDQLRRLAVDRELVPEEKITVIAPVSTPEQLAAEMDRWAQKAAEPVPSAGKAASSSSWWASQRSSEAAAAPQPASPPVQQRPAAVNEARPWKPPVAEKPKAPEVKPWQPAPPRPAAPPANSAPSGPQARPVSFPSVKRAEPAEEKPKKWWLPKE